MAARKRNSGDERVVGFRAYHGKRIAVHLADFGADRPLIGIGCFEVDEKLGNILRIKPEESLLGDPAILVAEAGFSGVILQDTRYGCDFCIVVARQPFRTVGKQTNSSIPTKKTN